MITGSDPTGPVVNFKSLASASPPNVEPVVPVAVAEQTFLALDQFWSPAALFSSTMSRLQTTASTTMSTVSMAVAQALLPAEDAGGKAFFSLRTKRTGKDGILDTGIRAPARIWALSLSGRTVSRMTSLAVGRSGELGSPNEIRPGRDEKDQQASDANYTCMKE
jgi:hypothetical protein